jgi:hypothetical protein
MVLFTKEYFPISVLCFLSGEHLGKVCVVRYAVQFAVLLISDAAVWQTREGALNALASLVFEFKM